MGASMGLKASLNLTKPIFKKLKYVTPQVELRSVANPEQFIVVEKVHASNMISVLLLDVSPANIIFSITHFSNRISFES